MARTRRSPRSVTSSTPPVRLYAALEGWRGVCACLVALFHFRQLGYDNVAVRSHIGTTGVVQNAYLFVDFFFVLSGFVIAASYQERLTRRLVSLRDFLSLRLGRLYPLVLFSMGLMLAEEAYRFWFMTFTGARQGFSDQGNTMVTFVVNVLLLQGLHVEAMNTWNRPSWSISAEFATYAVFAVSWILLGRRSWIATALVIVGAPLALLRLKGHIDATYDWGVIRAMLGFALGVVVHWGTAQPWWQRVRYRMSEGASSAAEAIVAIAVAVFVSWVARRPASIAAPFLFAIAVAVFAAERGVLGRTLASPPMRALGRWSYSIYMLHYPLQQVLFWVLIQLYATGWLRIARTTPPALEISRWAADGLNAVMLVVVIGASALAYRWVEMPWRERVRAAVARRQSRSGKGR